MKYIFKSEYFTIFNKAFLPLICVIFLGSSSGFAQDDFTNKTEAKNQMTNGLKEGKWLEYLNEAGDFITDTNKATYYQLTVYKAGKPTGSFGIFPN